MTTATIQPSEIPGGQYNLTPLVLTDQQAAVLQLDASGYLRVSLVGSGTGSGGDVNLADVGGAAIAIGQAAMAASLPVVLASNQSAIPVNLAAAITGGYTPNNITTSTTTVVKSGAGTLHGINVNTLGTVASTAVVYDNTAGSGTKLATIDTLSAGNVGWNQYDVAFATGLTIVTTGAPDITVSYK